jgi:hypothetical protein
MERTNKHQGWPFFFISAAYLKNSWDYIGYICLAITTA